MWMVSALFLVAPARTGSTPVAPSGTRDLRYAVLTQGRLSGSLVAEAGEDGITITYEYTDRGRGPKLTSRLALDGQGLPVSLVTEGVDYLKAPVEERFTHDAYGYSWISGSEKGGQLGGGGNGDPHAFYVATNATPFEIGLLARALAETPTGILPLLPGGEARLERVDARTVASAGSSRVRVAQVAIHGLDFAPMRVWLDADGYLFAQLDPLFSVVREGYEAAVPELWKAQQESQTRRAKETAHRLRHVPHGPVVLRHAAVFDPSTGTMRSGWTVVVKGARIAAAGPDASTPAPSGPKVEVIDATGKFLLPGLWDMHVHQSDGDGLLQLACGITTARDLGNDIDHATQMRADYRSGAAIGPRLVLAGVIDGPGPRAAPTKVLASTPEEARKWVDVYARRGYEQIKIYSSVAPSLVPVIIAAAKAHHLRVSGHIPTGMRAAEAVDDGYDEIQHVNYLLLNFASKDADTAGTGRFTLLADLAARLGDLRGPEVRALLDQLEAHHTVIDPTLNVYESMFTSRPGTIAPGIEAVESWLPAQVRRNYLGGGLPVDDKTDGPYRRAFDTMMKMVGRLYEEKIPLEVGSDAEAGFGFARELELRVEAGIPASDVLADATLRSARIMGKDKELGSIDAGKLADLVVLDADPLSDVGAVRRASLVVKDGVLFDPQALFAAAGVRRPPLGEPAAAAVSWIFPPDTQATIAERAHAIHR